MEFSELEQQRVDKIHQMRAAGIEPYPTRIERTHTIAKARAQFEAIENTEDAEPVQATLTGRIRSLRAMGKISFSHIEDATGTTQLFLRINDIGEEAFKQFKEFFNIGA